MPIKKGQRLNPNGRPKGSISAKVTAWNNIGEFIANQGAERLVEYLKTTNEKDYADCYLKILEYFKPKLARQELTGKDGEALFPVPIMDVSK